MNPLEVLARTGFLVKGVLYIVIGVLALRVATGLGGQAVRAPERFARARMWRTAPGMPA